jgi:hypothetical protein
MLHNAITRQLHTARLPAIAMMPSLSPFLHRVLDLVVPHCIVITLATVVSFNKMRTWVLLALCFVSLFGSCVAEIHDPRKAAHTPQI